MSRKIIKQIEKYLQDKFAGEPTGHDWYHLDRVRRNALKIASREGGDKFIIEVGALAHDIDDFKFKGGKNFNRTKKFLKKEGVAKDKIDKIIMAIKDVSFKGQGVKNKPETLEGKIIQDADRLAALGAIAVARVFAYGGYKGRPIYDPKIKPVIHKNLQEYKKAKSTSINHFYEKLLLLKDRLNTKTAKKMAGKRHQFLRDFLRQFLAEWQSP